MNTFTPKNRSTCILASSIASLLLSGAALHAQTISNWTNAAADNDWNNAANWSAGVPNGNNPYAVVNATGANRIIITTDIVNDPGHLRLGYASPDAGFSTAFAEGTISIISGSLHAGDWSSLGSFNAVGVMNVADDTQPAAPLTDGIYTGMATGTGSLLWNAGLLQFGAWAPQPGPGYAGGDGTLNINTSGTVTLQGFAVSLGDGGTARINMDNGTLNILNAQLALGGSGGNATLRVSGGTLEAHANINVGDGISNGGGSGTLSLSGGDIHTVEGGSITVGNTTYNGDNTPRLGATGTMTVSGGTLSSANQLYVGIAGAATATQTGGVVNVANAMGIGQEDAFGNSGAGTGTYTISAGALNVTQNLDIGQRSDNLATLNVSGGTVTAGSVTVGVYSAGEMNLSGTGVVNTSSLMISENDGSSGVLNMTNGSLNVSGDLRVQNATAGSGTFNFIGGDLSVDGTLYADQGTLKWTGGRLTRSTFGLIDIVGSVATNPNTILGLDGTDQNTKTFSVTGDLDIRSGITLELANYVLPSHADVGGFNLGYVGSIQGNFDLQNTFLTSLGVPYGVTRISETDAETPGFDLENHYWVAEDGGIIALSYNITVPEPATFVTLLGGLGVLVGLSRFRRRGAMV